MTVKLSSREYPRCAVVALDRELDAVHAAMAEQAAMAYPGPGRRVVVDSGDLESVDCHPLCALAPAAKRPGRADHAALQAAPQVAVLRGDGCNQLGRAFRVHAGVADLACRCVRWTARRRPDSAHPWLGALSTGTR